jgi:phosphopantetheinyl transferase
MRMAVASIAAVQDPSVLRGETERWSRMPSRRAAEFLAGRGLARRLAGAAGLRWRGLAAPSVRHKPAPVGGGYDLSISHDGGLVAVAIVGSGTVGIDVATHPLPTGITRALFAPDDHGLEPAEVLAAKEAYAKARGVGLALGFGRVSIAEIERMPGVQLLRHRVGPMRLCAARIEAGA